VLYKAKAKPFCFEAINANSSFVGAASFSFSSTTVLK
jgi:hypothetical protein